MLFETFFHLKTSMLFRRFKRFIKKTPLAKHDDNRIESDRQMLQRVSIKFITIIFFITMFDTLLDWFLGLLNIVMHLIHIGIEAIEYSLELCLTYLLNTNTHQSEIIIVNVAIIIALFLVCRLMFAAPKMYVRFKRNLRAAWLRHIRREASYWRARSLSHKIKCVSAYSFGTACLLLFVS